MDSFAKQAFAEMFGVAKPAPKTPKVARRRPQRETGALTQRLRFPTVLTRKP
jgi:hypothetical protein